MLQKYFNFMSLHTNHPVGARDEREIGPLVGEDAMGHDAGDGVEPIFPGKWIIKP